MSDFVALITIIIWPVVPLFWIPVHGLSKIFKKLGLLTYIMPLTTWLPLAYFIYSQRDFLLQEEGTRIFSVACTKKDLKN